MPRIENVCVGIRDVGPEYFKRETHMTVGKETVIFLLHSRNRLPFAGHLCSFMPFHVHSYNPEFVHRQQTVVKDRNWVCTISVTPQF